MSRIDAGGATTAFMPVATGVDIPVAAARAVPRIGRRAMSQFLEVIEWLDESGTEIVHRVPEGGSGETKLGAQLIVRDSQAAIFFKSGRGLDVFGPGRHTLSTLNLPILTKVLALPWGFTSPFRAEVYFVNQKVFTNLRWGTKEPVAFRDRELGLVRLRAFGAAMEIGLGAGLGMILPGMVLRSLRGEPITSPAMLQHGLHCPECHAAVSADSRLCARCGHQMVVARKCPRCAKNVTALANFCPSCGLDLASRLACTSCATPLPPGTRYCFECGEKVPEAPQPPPAAPAP
jgi:membrane protease subunit (stomatin/prohibitin family)